MSGTDKGVTQVDMDRGNLRIIDRPQVIGDGAMTVMVDEVADIGIFVGVRGWYVGNGAVTLEADGSPPCRVTPGAARPDVEASLGVGPGMAHGFQALVRAQESSAIRLRCAPTGGLESRLFAVPEVQSARDEAASAGVRRRFLDECVGTPGSAVSRGFLEFVEASPVTGCGLAIGWCALAPGASAWIVDDGGRSHPVPDAGALRLPRTDVDHAVGAMLAAANPRPGFVTVTEGMVPGSSARLLALEDGRVVELGRTQIGELPSDPTAVARILFGLSMVRHTDSDWMDTIAKPLIEPLLAVRRQAWSREKVIVRELGTRPERVEVSVVVPLYGRKDFIEAQVLALSKDREFTKRAELVYVIDDPSLLDPVEADLAWLARLCPMPVRWVWGGSNRGFSGANNLGAAHSQGDTLVFLNSDAFPREPGWWDAMHRVLGEQPSVGAVGARLLYPDGSLQHVGMDFRWREDLGVWINYHPLMGLEPALDDRVGISIVPAVTGACMALRRSDFEAVGGWDTDYLIGDFEDSDLCFKLRDQGLDIAYLPEVSLTHLERQSFASVGDDRFRQSVVIYNARRHQRHWLPYLNGEARGMT